MGQFAEQWQKYNEELDRLGKYLDQSSQQFQKVRTTRTNMLQRSLDKIEDLRAARCATLPAEDLENNPAE